MPHLVLEYSRDIEKEIPIPNLLQAIHQGAMDSELFPESDIKSRAIGYDHFYSVKDSKSFIHINVHLLSGRTDEQKYNLSHCIAGRLQKFSSPNINITIEIIDIHRDSYIKKA